MSSKSIRTKLFLLLALMGAIPFLVAVIFIGYRNVIHLDGHAREDSWGKNVTLNTHLTQELDKNFYVLRTLAVTPAVRDYLQAPTPQNEETMQKVLRDANLVFKDGNPLAIVDTIGNQLYRTDQSPKVNISKRKNFQEVMNGQDYVSDVMISKSTGQLLVVIGTPVYDSGHRVIGMVERNFYLDELQNFIQSQDNDFNSIYLLDRENKIVAHSEGDKALEEIDISQELDLITQALDGHQGTAQIEVEGKKLLTTYAKNHLSGWTVVTLMPYSHIWGTVNDAIMRGAILGFIVMLFVNLAAHLMATRITRPIREITDTITKIASGKTNIDQLHVFSDDELGEMAMAVNEMRAMQENANNATMRDFLTGLASRESLEILCRKRLQEYMEAANSPGLVAIILIDLDNFKKANKSEGHEYGNHALKDFATRLSEHFGSTTYVGRLEADEFMVILSHQKDVAAIKKSAEAINHMAREITVEGNNAGLSASIGVSVAPRNGKTYNQLYHAADLALFKAKEKGRDCYQLADDDA